MYPPPTPAQCRGLCSWPARRQAWSAPRSPGSWSWGPCWGPQLWLGPWLPGAGAGCAWLLATGRAACCPGEGRKHLGVTFPGRWLPWRCATLGCWASPSHASERAATLAHPACPAPPPSSPQRRPLQPVLPGQCSAPGPGDGGPRRLCSLAPVAQLQAFAFVGERLSSAPHGGAVLTTKASPGPSVEPCPPLSPQHGHGYLAPTCGSLQGRCSGQLPHPPGAAPPGFAPS